jgi:hypothetical protein
MIQMRPEPGSLVYAAGSWFIAGDPANQVILNGRLIPDPFNGDRLTEDNLIAKYQHGGWAHDPSPCCVRCQRTFGLKPPT